MYHVKIRLDKISRTFNIVVTVKEDNMFIELPNSIKEEEILKYARIENGTLHFWNLWKFQEIMSVLRKEMSSNRCIYCGCDLKNYTTMDHLYPVTYGGINITDNLGLACKTCNSNKEIGRASCRERV